MSKNQNKIRMYENIFVFYNLKQTKKTKTKY